MATPKNPWEISSIYELQFFNCPSCHFKVKSTNKQSFINHAYETHPESIDHLIALQDGSISDIIVPWQDIKAENNDYTRSSSSETQKSDLSSVSSNLVNYCKHCCKLFGSKKSYDLHQQQKHDEDQEGDDSTIQHDIEDIKIEDDGPANKIVKYKFIEIPPPTKKIKKQKVDVTVPLSAVGSIPKPIYKPKKPIEKKECVCDQCGKISPSQYALNAHVKFVHKNVRNFPCNHCPKRFQKQLDLRDHVNNVHLNIKAYQCDSCGEAFRTQYQLREHIKHVHEGIKKKVFKCDSCDRTFSRKQVLDSHIDVAHKGVKKFVCEICNLVCMTPSQLKKHKDAVHEKIKRYACNQCDSRFTAGSSLKDHIINVHEKRLQYQCTSCGKGFKKRYLMEKHFQDEHIGENE